VRKSEIELGGSEAQTKSRIDWLGLSYNLGVAQLFFSHATREDKVTDIANAAAEITAGDIKVNTIGIAVPMGAVTLNASMYDGDNSGGVGGADDRGLKGHQVSARYALSKRTFVYAVTGTNKDSRKDTTQDNDDFKRTQTQFGVVHSF
jgi:predicted porin